MIAVVIIGLGGCVKLLPNTKENQEIIQAAIREIGTRPDEHGKWPAMGALEKLLATVQPEKDYYDIWRATAVATVTLEW